MTRHQRLHRKMSSPVRQARRAKKRPASERAREYMATRQPASALRDLFSRGSAA